MKKYFLIFAAILLVAQIAHAHSYQLGKIKIGHAWMQELHSTGPEAADNAEVAAYMPLYNTGEKTDYLIEVKSDWFAQAKFLDLRGTGETGSPQAVFANEIALLKGTPIGMQPKSGWRIVFYGVKKPMPKGETLPVTLVFKNAGSIEVELALDPEKPSHQSN
ncbi:MAG: copper chaperone PCu(A)C [Alphaproteobacteria bacterium]|nr:MAG: copper chaperone PCu(A)C [Alphaproteobacteria bacterium]